MPREETCLQESEYAKAHVGICIRTYACMNACMNACMHVCVYVYMYVCMYVCMYTYPYVCVCACVCICLFVSMRQCFYIDVCFMYVCIYTCACIPFCVCVGFHLLPGRSLACLGCSADSICVHIYIYIQNM